MVWHSSAGLSRVSSNTEKRIYVYVHCWLGDRQGILPVKTGYWFVDGDILTGPFTFSVVTTTSIILSSNKLQNGNFLVPANPGPPGEWPLKRKASVFVFTCLIGMNCSTESRVAASWSAVNINCCHLLGWQALAVASSKKASTRETSTEHVWNYSCVWDASAFTETERSSQVYANGAGC